MPFNYARMSFLVCILTTALLSAHVSFASSITGDKFTVTVSEDFGTIAGSESGTAGSPGDDVGLDTENAIFDVDWIDGDTFNLDFYSSASTELENLTITLTGLDFVNGGIPVDIMGVTPLPLNDFDWDKQVTFTKDSITIVYPYLSIFEAADGSSPTFEVIAKKPGDLDSDGNVDADDIKIFARYYGSDSNR